MICFLFASEGTLGTHPFFLNSAVSAKIMLEQATSILTQNSYLPASRITAGATPAQVIIKNGGTARSGWHFSAAKTQSLGQITQNDSKDRGKSLTVSKLVISNHAK
ncbi:hypothetical protein L6R21_12545 [bacterium]|nr:hypothetical protein [bacterium]